MFAGPVGQEFRLGTTGMFDLSSLRSQVSFLVLGCSKGGTAERSTCTWLLYTSGLMVVRLFHGSSELQARMFLCISRCCIAFNDPVSLFSPLYYVGWRSHKAAQIQEICPQTPRLVVHERSVKRLGTMSQTSTYSIFNSFILIFNLKIFSLEIFSQSEYNIKSPT